VETWDYVNWLTHAKNAVRMDAEIGLKTVEHLLGMFTAARLRMRRTNQRCDVCGSYELIAGLCSQCGWADPSYEPPKHKVRRLSAKERARRLAEPHTLSSDISTFLSPEDFRS
jgi:ribosomal protein L37E